MAEVYEQTIRELCDNFESHGQKVAILSFGAENKKQLHFRELATLVRELAAGLLKTDLTHQETVMLLANNSPDLMIASLSVIYAGGIAVPVDLQSSDEVLKHIIKDSKAKRAFVDANGLLRLERLHKDKHLEVIRLDSDDQSDNWRKLLSKRISQFSEELKPEDQAVLFYTSGTTGLPKGVPLTHTNITAQIEAVKKTHVLEVSDRVLLPLPLFHVYPFVDGFLSPLALGLTVILPKAVTGPEVIRAIKEGKATVLVSVPRLLRALYAAIEAKANSNNIDKNAFELASNLSGFLNIFGINIGKKLFAKIHKRFPTLRLLACGGALLEPALAKKLIELGWQVAVGYGLTETSPLLTFRLPGNRDLKSVGKPIAGVEVRLQKVDDSERNEENQQSEIQVKGKSIFGGYRNLPDKTKETFTADGWFKTGDTGYMLFGNLHVTGRISTMLKTEGGKKVPPEEIEKAYEKDPAIREVGILQSKEQLVALVVPNITAIGKGDAHEKISAIIKKASETMPSYYRVNDFAISRDLLPRTNLGKIRRHDLIEAYDRAKLAEKDGKASKTHHEEESPEDKAMLEEPAAKSAWQWLHERFPDADITLSKSPQLDLNVDSLEWLNLTLEIQERLGIELNEEAISRIDTIRDLIKEIVEASKSGSHKVSPFEKPESILDDDQKKWLKPLGPKMLFFARLLYSLNFAIMRLCFRVSAVGLEDIPKGQVIFTPNHASYLDAFALSAVLGMKRLHKTQWAGWAGIALANPFNAFIYRLSQAIPIEANRSLISSLALASAVLKKHRSLVWFPEGEMTSTGKLLPFKSGIGTLLLHFSIKVVPVCIKGTYEDLPHGAFFPRFEKITVIFGDPILPEELLKEGNGNTDAEKIANALHDRVQKLKAKKNL